MIQLQKVLPDLSNKNGKGSLCIKSMEIIAVNHNAAGRVCTVVICMHYHAEVLSPRCYLLSGDGDLLFMSE